MTARMPLLGHQTHHDRIAERPHQEQLQLPWSRLSGDSSRQHTSTEVGLLTQDPLSLSIHDAALQLHAQIQSSASQQLLSLQFLQNCCGYAHAASLPLALGGGSCTGEDISPANFTMNHSSFAVPNHESMLSNHRAVANVDLSSFSTNNNCSSSALVNQPPLVDDDTRCLMTPQEIHQRSLSNIASIQDLKHRRVTQSPSVVPAAASHQDTGSHLSGPSSSIKTQVEEKEKLDSCNDNITSGALDTADKVMETAVGSTKPSARTTGRRKRSRATTFPLGIPEDPNWLSEYHCFIRSELVEVFQASQDDVSNRRTRKALSLGQVGMRCRFCSAYDTGLKKRAGRSTAFPSSLQQIYQSMIMMIREHFKDCPGIPDEMKRKFCELQENSSSRAQESKSYWVHSAMKLGMRDSDPKSRVRGIMIVDGEADRSIAEKPAANEQTRNKNATIEDNNAEALSTSVTLPNDPTTSVPIESPTFLVERADRRHTSEFLFNVMSQFVMCNTVATVIIGECKMPSGEYVRPSVNGLTKEEPARVGCQHCMKKGSGYYGAAQLHVRRKFHLPDRVTRMVDHLKRCTSCPDVVKDALKHLQEQNDHSIDYANNKIFYDRVWTRLKKPSARKKKKW